MAQLLNAWLRQIIERELRLAIEWQSSIDKDQLKELKRIKVEPNKYRYNGQKLWINIPVVPSNRLHVQFLNFTTNRQPPYRCFVADGQFSVAAQFSADCERKFGERSHGRQVSDIASGVVLGLNELSLVVQIDSREGPFSLEINEVVAKNILQEAVLVGKRSPLGSIEELTSLVTTLAHLLDKDRKASNLSLEGPRQTNPTVETSTSHVNDSSSDRQKSHTEVVRSAPISQIPVTEPVIQSQSIAAPVQETTANTSISNRGSSTLRRRGQFRGRGHGQMGDRLSTRNKMLNVDVPLGSTYITEEDDGFESDSDQTYRLKDRHVAERRVDSSIDSDPHSARSSHPASPVSAKVAPIQSHSRFVSQRRSPPVIMEKPDVSQIGQREEQAVTSPLAQTQAVQSKPACSSSKITPPVSTRVVGNFNIDAPAINSWHGGRRPARSRSIIPDDQVQILRQQTSMCPPSGRQPFPPGNIPLSILQQESRRAENEVGKRVNGEIEAEQTTTLKDASSKNEDQPDLIHPESPASSPALDWSRSPSPIDKAKRGQCRQPSLPPDSSNPSPDASPVKPQAIQAVKKAMEPPPTIQATSPLSKRQTESLRGALGYSDGQSKDAHNHRIPGLDLMRVSATKPGQAEAGNTTLPRPGTANSLSTQQGDDGELETNVPRALGGVQSSPASNSTPGSQNSKRHTPRSSSREPRATQDYTSSASDPAVQVRNTDETRRFRSSGAMSPRVPSTYQPPRSPLAQPARVSKSFDDRYDRSRFGDRTYRSSDWSNGRNVDSYRPEPRSSVDSSRPPVSSERSQASRSQPADSTSPVARQSNDNGTPRTPSGTPRKVVPQTPKAAALGLPPRPPPCTSPDTRGRDSSRPTTTQKDAYVGDLVPTPPRRPGDSARSQFRASAAQATPTQSTQDSSVVSQDPANSISKTKSAFVNKIYNKSGLFSVFTEAYPSIGFVKASFDSIIKYKLWPAREDIPAKMFDDFVIQYKTKYEGYVLEQEMQGLEKLPYLDFYRQKTVPQGTINRIITYGKLNDFMAEMSSPARAIKVEQVENVVLLRNEAHHVRPNSTSNGHGSPVSRPAALDLSSRADRSFTQANNKKRSRSSQDEIANNKRMRQGPSETTSKHTEYHTQFRRLKSNQSTGEAFGRGGDDFWRSV